MNKPKEPTPELDVLIAQALSSDRASSEELSALIEQMTNAVANAEETAKAEREKALDPIASPDAATSEQAVWAAELKRDRRRSELSRLRLRLDEVRAAEHAAQRQADREEITRRRDALVREFIELYPPFVSRFIDFAERTAAVDKECARFNMPGVELTARNIESFSRSEPSIIEAVRLPDFGLSDRMAWPTPQPPLAAKLAALMTPSHDPRFSANWAAARQKDNERRATTEARWEEEEAARQEASKKAYEASLRR